MMLKPLRLPPVTLPTVRMLRRQGRFPGCFRRCCRRRSCCQASSSSSPRGPRPRCPSSCCSKCSSICWISIWSQRPQRFGSLPRLCCWFAICHQHCQHCHLPICWSPSHRCCPSCQICLKTNLRSKESKLFVPKKNPLIVRVILNSSKNKKY